mgnify:CR=1 FL=1
MVKVGSTPYSIRISDVTLSRLHVAGIAVQKYVQMLLDNSTLEKATIEHLIEVKKSEIKLLENFLVENPTSDDLKLSAEEIKALEHAKIVIRDKGPEKFLGQMRNFNNKFNKNYDARDFNILLERVEDGKENKR